MAAELDHLFICVSRGAAEASALAAFGLNEGKPNVHPGQGTACRRFFFRNGYIELLWVSNEAEAQSEAIRPTHLWERWVGRGSGSCPFGIGFRPGAHQVASPPFPAWEYRPPYLPVMEFPSRDECRRTDRADAVLLTLPSAARRSTECRTPKCGARGRTA
jgi:hypothetical protein